MVKRYFLDDYTHIGQHISKVADGGEEPRYRGIISTVTAFRETHEVMRAQMRSLLAVKSSNGMASFDCDLLLCDFSSESVKLSKTIDSNAIAVLIMHYCNHDELVVPGSIMRRPPANAGDLGILAVRWPILG